MTLCVGKPIIQILAKDGAWQSANGEALVAADELFHNDPYAEIERLQAFARWVEDHSNDPEVVLQARRAQEPKT